MWKSKRMFLNISCIIILSLNWRIELRDISKAQ